MFKSLKAASDKLKSIVTPDDADDENPPQTPTYMQEVNHIELTAAYGKEVSDRVFSDEFTDVRISALVQGLPDAPELSFGMYVLYPNPTDDNQIFWIEKYIVNRNGEFRKNLLMSLVDGVLDVMLLVPGESLASPLLQSDTLTQVVSVAMGEGEESTAAPELVDTVVMQSPEGVPACWSERWTFAAQDKLIAVDINFTSSEDGGTMIVHKLAPDQ